MPASEENIRSAWVALKLVRLTIEQGVAERGSSFVLFGSEPVHEGEALAKSIIETVERLAR
ncbi:MAG: hypothetical protein E5V25_16225 [Mesorhizobium sp.]|nr:MAG: hypothetical protein EOQ41_05920 [Mesorhizobium sp.]RWC34040.1 MAG: hypothetical protein EOS70_14830 [Mesorhizobium sp.]RWD35475.1 MAG: hypothetical protein EOS34_14310 [Mesorhizobium sp.]RWD47507.1 MAG: hypothetical protein EOS35_05675 [Mesorhizobium sp.]RWD80319.1 MAG: hypothetical protein EOS48_19210 [Mesorhizobium sp.]